MLPRLKPDEALPIAEFCRPEFTQYLGHDNRYDFPCSIMTGKWFFQMDPPAHISVCCDEANYYIWYCWYHYRDVAGPGQPDMKPFRHRHDLEGAMIAVRKQELDYAMKRSGRKPTPNWSCCRFHHEVKVQIWGTDQFGIEPYGHGIFPLSMMKKKLNEHYNSITYRLYPLICLDDPRMREYLDKTVIPQFAREGVSLPWEWSDRRIRPKSLLWENPSVYLQAVLDRGIVKP